MFDYCSKKGGWGIKSESNLINNSFDLFRFRCNFCDLGRSSHQQAQARTPTPAPILIPSYTLSPHPDPHQQAQDIPETQNYSSPTSQNLTFRHRPTQVATPVHTKLQIMHCETPLRVEFLDGNFAICFVFGVVGRLAIQYVGARLRLLVDDGGRRVGGGGRFLLDFSSLELFGLEFLVFFTEVCSNQSYELFPRIDGSISVVAWGFSVEVGLLYSL